MSINTERTVYLEYAGQIGAGLVAQTAPLEHQHLQLHLAQVGPQHLHPSVAERTGFK